MGIYIVNIEKLKLLSICINFGILFASYRDCREIYLYTKTSGHYEIEQNGFTFNVFCDFTQPTGYMFLAKDAISETHTIALNELYDIKSHFKIIFFMEDGRQKEVVTEQLDQFSDQDIRSTYYPTSSNIDAFNAFGANINMEMLSIPDSDATGLTRGFKGNGISLNFINCDSNPSAYFSFYQNPTNSRQSLFTYNYTLTYDFIETAVAMETPILDTSIYGLAGLIAFGGCGSYNLFTNWPPSPNGEMIAFSGLAVPFRKHLFTFPPGYGFNIYWKYTDLMHIGTGCQVGGQEEVVKVRSRLQCGMICRSKEWCFGANFAKGTDLCSLLYAIGGRYEVTGRCNTYRIKQLIPV